MEKGTLVFYALTAGILSSLMSRSIIPLLACIFAVWAVSKVFDGGSSGGGGGGPSAGRRSGMGTAIVAANDGLG